MSPAARRATLITVLVAAFIAVVIVIVVAATRASSPNPFVETAPTPQVAQVLRDDTHILVDAGPDAPVLVEFLDFECEVCGAFFPIVEELKAEYGDRVTFAFRYFPLPGHGNSVNAALAVEAAAQQDALEPMFQRMFESQAQWGERGDQSQAPVFRTYAEELGLDMAAYDAAVADPATLARIQADFDEGRALGVDSTPSFFLDGVALELQSFDDVEAALRAALGE
jgi:protein-disulfide isomerase